MQSDYTEEELDQYDEEIWKAYANGIHIDYWTTIDDKNIPFNRLKEQHLLNIIKHLEERIKNRDSKSAYVKESLETRKKLQIEYMSRFGNKVGKVLYGR